MDYRQALERIKNTPHRELKSLAVRANVPFSTIRGIRYSKGRWPSVPLVEKIAAAFLPPLE